MTSPLRYQPTEKLFLLHGIYLSAYQLVTQTCGVALLGAIAAGPRRCDDLKPYGGAEALCGQGSYCGELSTGSFATRFCWISFLAGIYNPLRVFPFRTPSIPPKPTAQGSRPHESRGFAISGFLSTSEVVR